MTVFTEQLMDDLGANSIYDLMAFAPNTDPFIMSTSDITGNGNDFINIPTKFVSRGGASTVVGQDFFTNNIPNDRFNSEALTFTRGPNAILFGLGNAAGAFVSSTKRAKNRTATTIEYQSRRPRLLPRDPGPQPRAQKGSPGDPLFGALRESQQLPDSDRELPAAPLRDAESDAASRRPRSG
jgi:hypothetical protein